MRLEKLPVAAYSAQQPARNAGNSFMRVMISDQRLIYSLFHAHILKNHLFSILYPSTIFHLPSPVHIFPQYTISKYYLHKMIYAATISSIIDLS